VSATPPRDAPAGSVDVSVVVVTHDTLEEVRGCLASIAAAEVIVVDSGSRDGTVETLRREHPEVQVLALHNVGFGRGANAGIRHARAPIVVVCNADVRFAPDALRRLVAAFELDDRLGAVGPAVRYPEGGHQASARIEPDLLTALGHAVLGGVRPDNRFTRRYRQLDADPDVARDVDWLSGCALALRREAVVGIGGFDPGYFLYVEDVDLAARLRAAGWRVRYEPAAQVTHRVGASTRMHRWRALRAHARSLDRYHRLRHGHGLPGKVSRPFVRLGLLAWAVVTWTAGRLRGPGSSSTGERSSR
jgi:N-acetylglucosaminyl-diphospho-decaprenol L-rhamnosyltransferase